MSHGKQEYATAAYARLDEALRDAAHEGAVAAALPRPQQVGPYRVLEVIGEGGMGAVYKAEQTRPVRRTVAVKLIKPGLDSREVLARFDAERQALARMDHPNIAKVLDAGADDLGRPYFVMEYVPGLPITRFCDEHRLPLRDRLELFCQACEAIAHAHTKAIIHRDIKSSNVLAYLQDGRPVVKVIDFGVAKAITGDRLSDATFSTDRGSIIGTYDSMSPEQADGSRDIDTRTDVYSLGVLLYELLAGSKPFDHRTLREAPDHEVRRIIREVEPPHPSARVRERAATAGDRTLTHADRLLARQLRGELGWIPLMAMRKERDRRYASPLLLAEDVRNYLAGRPLSAGPESRVYIARKFLRRHRGSVAGAVVALLLIVAGVVFYVRDIRAEQARTLAALETAERERATAEAVQAFLSDMIRAPKPEQAQGKPVLVEDVVRRAADGIGDKFKDQPLVEAELRNTFADTLISLGKLDLAEEQLRRSLEIRRRELGPDAPRTLVSMFNLGQAMAQRSRGREAEPMLREAYEGLRRTRGPDDVSTLQSQNTLAAVLRNLDKLEESERLNRDVWERRKRLYGEEDESTLISQSNLAGVLRDMGRVEEAEQRYRQALDGRRRTLGDDHPATISSVNNLAALLQSQRRLDEAEPMLRDALARNRRILGDEHPNTIGSINNLGSMLSRAKQFDEAEPLLREAVELNLRTVGPDHRHTITTRQVLAMLLLDTGRAAEAADVLRDGLARSERLFGPDHSDTVRLVMNLAEALDEMGRADEAEELYRDAIARRTRALGPEHPDTLVAMHNLAALLRGENRFAEAEAIYVDIVERASGPGSKVPPAQLARFRAGHAVAVSDQGDPARSLPLLREALDAMRATGQPNHESAITLLKRLVADSESAGLVEEARTRRSELAAAAATTMPATAPATAPNK